MKAEGGVNGRREPEDIEERTLAYAVRAVRLFQALQRREDRAGWIVGKQFLRAATSIGANVAEARSGETRRDFVHKLQVAQKEARESLYRLMLLERTAHLPPDRLSHLVRETDEIVAILTTIIRKAKRPAAD